MGEFSQVLGERALPWREAYTVVAADDTAGTKAIATPLARIDNFIVQIDRSDVDVKVDAAVTISGGTITIADGAVTYALTAGDIIRVWAWGVGGF